jgi:nucleotide-binding universal stress UspA family protein
MPEEIAVVLVVGYDRHPASRAALIFAGELAGALNVPLHVVHVVDDADDAVTAPTTSTSRSAGDRDTESRYVADALDAANVSWTYHRLRGDPATVLVETTNQHSASMLIVGRPEHGVGAAVGHLITGSVARNVLRHSNRPVVVVPEFGTVRQ